MDAMILTEWDDIRDALEAGFTGSVVLTNRREVKGNVRACNHRQVGGVWQNSGPFNAVTVTPATGYQTFRRIATQDILAVVVKDI